MPETFRLEDLGCDRRHFEVIKSLGLVTLADLLQADPEPIVQRPACARQVIQALERIQPRYPQVTTLLERLCAPIPKTDEPQPTSPLEHALAILKRRREPMTFRRLREEVIQASAVRNLVTLRRELSESPAVLFYPFGSHQWVGLRDWGNEGIRAAARASWLVLPLHLESLLRLGRTEEVSAQVLAVLQELADETNHRDLLRLLARWEKPPEPVPQPAQVQETPAAYTPGLLQTLAHNETIMRLADPIVRGLGRLQGTASLCQLRASPADLEWLRTWAANLTAGQVTTWLEGVNPCFDAGGRIVSQRECFGLLFMLLACEVCRRESSEGHVWTEICPCFAPRVRPVLFSGTRARAPLALALEAACRRFQLHHAFGIEGVQAWYQSFYLQFGFTKSAISKLPTWLTIEESQPVAVTALRQSSPEFATLWQALGQYRHQRTPQARAQLTRVLEESSYVLLEWRAELMQAAIAPGPTPQEGQFRETGEEVAYPLLSWPLGDHPRFAIRPASMFRDLVDPAYTLYHDEEPVARIFREPEGYVSEPGEVSFPPRHDRIHVTLVGDGEEDVRELELQLWESEELYSAYHLTTGARLEVLTPGQPCALLLAEGVTLEPPAPHSASCGKTGFRLHQLPAGLSAEHRMLADGQEIARVAEPRTPDWARELRLAFRQEGPARLPCRVTFDLMTPPGVRVRWARFGRQSLALQEIPGIGWRGQVLLEPDLPTARVRIHLGLERDGQRVRMECSETVRLRSVTAWLGGAWTVLECRPRLRVSEAREGSFRFFTDDASPREFGLIEGDVFSTRPRAGTRSLGRLAGFGGELRLRQGPFNADNEGALLCSEVVDKGLIKELKTNQEQFELHLHRPVEGDEDHFLVWWDGKGEPILQEARHLTETEGSVWKGPIPKGASALCVGFGYQGVRLGSAWDDKELILSKDPQSPARLAGLLRWLHLPILRGVWLPAVQELARRYPVEFLESWLKADGVAEIPTLRFEAELAEWFTVVREVFRGFQPKEDTVLARRVFNRVSADAILRASPILYVRLAQAAWSEDELRKLQAAMVGCAPSRVAVELQALEATAAWEMDRMPDAFVRALIRRVEQIMRGKGKALDRREQLNLGLALGFASFRRALAARLLL